MKRRGALVKKNCECCAGEFSARLADHLRGWARFCSKSCKLYTPMPHTPCGR